MRFDTDDDDNVEVQMTPMIDCVFLLLIFFLVATVMKKIDKELPVELPESAAAIDVQKSSDTMVIGISKAGEYFVNGDAVGLEMLHVRLREVGRDDPEQSIRIDGDRAAVMQHLIHILDLCKFEGLKNVSIHTRSDGADGYAKRK
jgi:biopolymer transport protein ExbD